MTPPQRLFTSLPSFLAASRGERDGALQGLLACLGPDFVPGVDPRRDRNGETVDYGLPRVHHQPTGVCFVVVPGGTFEMGLSETDVDRAMALVDWTPEVARFVEQLKSRARPLREVLVEPFLCAVEPLLVPQVAAWTNGGHARDTFTAPDAERWVTLRPGFRLPSEAELEYLARDGVQQSFIYDGARTFDDGIWPEQGRFGVRRLTDNEWTADEWHDDYTGAPPTSAPWRTGDGPPAFRGLSPDPPEVNTALVLTLASARGKPMAAERNLCARPVFPLGSLLS